MSTPSQQTNRLLETLERLPEADLWEDARGQIRSLSVAQKQNRTELGEKATARGPAFLEQAESRLHRLAQAFDRYALALEALEQELDARRSQSLPPRIAELRAVTADLFGELDSYAGFYFSWGENQSPLVTIIRQAVESYSRSALQSSQAQRILRDMEEQFSPSKPDSAGGESD